MTVELSPEEIDYLRRLLVEHVNYHRLLSGNGKCSQKNHAQRRFLEALWAKLSK